MELALLSHTVTRHAEATAEAFLVQLPEGVVMEFLDLRTATPADIAALWARTANLRPVPGVTPQMLDTLRAKLAASDFRLHQLTRAERQLDDLLRALAAGDPDDLVQACRDAQAQALGEFADGSPLSAIWWLALGARFAEHHFKLEAAFAERLWASLKAAAPGGVVTVDAADLPPDAASSIRGAIAAQERARVDRAAALEQLRALVAGAAADPTPD